MSIVVSKPSSAAVHCAKLCCCVDLLESSLLAYVISAFSYAVVRLYKAIIYSMASENDQVCIFFSQIIFTIYVLYILTQLPYTKPKHALPVVLYCSIEFHQKAMPPTYTIFTNI